jgi:hypothetical protein
MAKRRSLSDAFGDPESRKSTVNSEPVNTARDTNMSRSPAIIATGEVEMVPGGRTGEMVPADKPVNMTFTVTAKERYLWTLELKRRGRTAVSVLRDAMEELGERDG